MKRSRLLVVGLAALLALGAGLIARRASTPFAASPASGVGGRFSLIDQDGRTVDERLLRGHWSVVFFGYTSCPDVCPTTLTALGQAVLAIRNAEDRPRVVFITVDPERDTPAQLKLYLASPAFPKGVLGLTGSPARIAAAAKAYRVYFRKVPDGPTYSMDHTSVVYLMDPEGRFSRPLDMTAPPGGVARQISAALKVG